VDGIPDHFLIGIAGWEFHLSLVEKGLAGIP